MSDTPTSSSVSVGLIRVLKAYAENIGLDFNAVAGSAGLDMAVLEDSEARVSGSYFEAMWRQIIAGSQDPHPGLQFGRQMAGHYPGGNILFTMMMNCATIGQALETFIRYHRIMADAIQPQLVKDGDRVRLSWDVFQPGFTPHPYLSEALLCTYHSILAHLSREAFQPQEVCFTHAAPKVLSKYQEVFRSPLRFDAERNELVIGADTLDLQIHSAIKELLHVRENYALRLADTLDRENIWSRQVIRLISEMFEKGITPDIDSISKNLALSKRNLQEKLKDEKTNFRNCLERVRKQIAIDYLIKPGITICDVTFLLGYSEQSAFNHAFRRWTSRTPKEFIREKSANSRMA